MFDQILQLDQQLFLGINQGLSNAFFDWIMPLLRNRYFWMPLYLFLCVFFIANYKKTGILLLLFMFIAFGAADYSASSIIKPTFERLRPCNDPALKNEVNARVACGTGYSMPSAHATNHFAIALFLITLFYKRWRWILPLALLWAASVGFAQIYVGVHYPSDILMGSILGCLLGFIVATLFTLTSAGKKWNSGD